MRAGRCNSKRSRRKQRDDVDGAQAVDLLEAPVEAALLDGPAAHLELGSALAAVAPSTMLLPAFCSGVAAAISSTADASSSSAMVRMMPEEVTAAREFDGARLVAVQGRGEARARAGQLAHSVRGAGPSRAPA